MPAPADANSFIPPYNVPWATFMSTIERVVADLPNRVDRAYLGNQSGSTQTYLISAYKGFELIDEEMRVTDLLKTMVEPDDRKRMMGELLRRHYSEAVELGNSNSTEGELTEAFARMFPSVNGESRVKAIRFFLNAAEYADLPRSRLWKNAKPGRATPGRRRRKPDPNAGPAASNNGAGGPKATDPAALRARYFEVLLKKAEEAEELDSELLDRIEKLLAGPAQE